ncbi:hypothetical protein [uncultured Demequina sp.]|uniref:hypothetical protein n=1 Tax=uncultured Demequina sp. TaxID=693499 RepID=UPI0025DAAFAD|nr:hypothetical protein [uncultured Demequina sp.]
MSGQDVEKVALAAVGCTQFVMGHNRSGKFGMVKEAFAMRSALGDIPSGPGHDLIQAAKDHLSGDNDSGPNVDATDKDLMISTGRAYIDGVLPVLASLPADAAENVRTWLLGVAQNVAEASKDKGGSDKVSPEEAAAIDELRTLLAG